MEQTFKTYIGTKTVKAMPMDARHAKQAGANVPEKYFSVGHSSYNPGADGYLVEYSDGYRSWSPAKVFEQAYKVAETNLDRMTIEMDEVGSRICRATQSLYVSDKALCLSQSERTILEEQLSTMKLYFKILLRRYNRVCSEMIAKQLVESDNKDASR